MHRYNSTVAQKVGLLWVFYDFATTSQLVYEGCEIKDECWVDLSLMEIAAESEMFAQ